VLAHIGCRGQPDSGLILGFEFCYNESKSNYEGFWVETQFLLHVHNGILPGLHYVTLNFSGAAAQLPATLLFLAGA
jgi:hypothetical protein